MRLAKIRCFLGRHEPSAVRAVRHDDGWISNCRHCRAPMAYLDETGWFTAHGGHQSYGTAARRWTQAAALALAMVPLQSSAAHNDGLLSALSVENHEAPSALAERLIDDFERSGMHCRSLIDGSNADAVAQAKARAAQPGTFKHLDTEIRAEEHGRHSFAMAYSVDDAHGQETMRRSFGWIDTGNCTARISHT